MTFRQQALRAAQTRFQSQLATDASAIRYAALQAAQLNTASLMQRTNQPESARNTIFSAMYSKALTEEAIKAQERYSTEVYESLVRAAREKAEQRVEAAVQKEMAKLKPKSTSSSLLLDSKPVSARDIAPCGGLHKDMLFSVVIRLEARSMDFMLPVKK